MRTPPKRSARLGERKSEEKPPTQRVGGMKFFGRAAALSRGAPAFIMIFQEMCRGGLRFSEIYGIVKAGVN